MSNTLLIRLFKTKVALKIWKYTICFSLVMLLITYGFTSIYTNTVLLHTIEQNVFNEGNHIASSFSHTYQDYIKKLVLKTSSKSFKSYMDSLLNCDEISYAENNNRLQPLITELVQMNNLVASIAITSHTPTGNVFYHAYQYPLPFDIDTINAAIYPTDPASITILPTISKNNTHYLPVVYPLSYEPEKNFTFIPRTFQEANLMIYIFFDLSKIDTYLSLCCNDDYEGTLFLVNKQGNKLAPTDNIFINNDISFNSNLQNQVTLNRFLSKYNDDYIAITPIDHTTLYLVNVIASDFLLSDFHAQANIFIIIGLVALFILNIACVLISLLISRPINALTQVVYAIQQHHYRGRLDLHRNDELQQLGDAIDDMYQTIQKQIKTIQEEEAAKYLSHLQMLSEQINPHFIYNALEFINIEIYNNHPENASHMLTSLAKYLRISLSYGENALTVRQELEQIQAYIEIMNYRFNSTIQIHFTVSEALLNYKIPKSTLQSLVENAVKHAFKIETSVPFPITPLIEVSGTQEEEYLILSVADNGIGIDVEKVTQIMLTKSSQDELGKHFGLNHIYECLNSFYGNAMVTFSSIPFFENKVTIRIPK